MDPLMNLFKVMDNQIKLPQILDFIDFPFPNLNLYQAIYSMLGADEENVDLSPEARTDEIFEKMDENGDGILTREEFMKGCMADKQLYSMLLADDPASD